MLFLFLRDGFSNDASGIACLRYDPETKTWMQRSTKGDTHDAVWETISESEANVMQSAYTPLCLEMKPLSQFPMDR